MFSFAKMMMSAREGGSGNDEAANEGGLQLRAWRDYA
jgi:hypothetical protein